MLNSNIGNNVPFQKCPRLFVLSLIIDVVIELKTSL